MTKEQLKELKESLIARYRRAHGVIGALAAQKIILKFRKHVLIAIENGEDPEKYLLKILKTNIKKYLEFTYKEVGVLQIYNRELKEIEKRFPREKHYEFCEENREAIICQNLRIAYKVALKYRYTSPSESLSDLIQESNMGLIAAFNKFDPEAGAKFSTYAWKSCVHYITGYLDKYSRIIYMPKSHIYKYKKENGRYPVDLAGTSIEFSHDDDSPTIAERYAVEEIDISKIDAYNIVSGFFKTLFNKLSVKEQEILKLVYGIGMAAPVPAKIIAENYGLTDARISQICKYALIKMKNALPETVDAEELLLLVKKDFLDFNLI